MKLEFKEFATGAILHVDDKGFFKSFSHPTRLGHYTFIRTLDRPLKIQVDSLIKVIAPHTIIALSPIQYFLSMEAADAIVYQFNREFYCIKEHDREVSCTGILFFGHETVPQIPLDAREQGRFKVLHDVILDEFENKDSIQAEMLRMLIKRFIIKTTRLLKAQHPDAISKTPKMDLLRNFNMLVEEYFRNKHDVSSYAELLFKSPKTLSNSFAAYDRTPLQIIHDRIVLEAKRLLFYSDQTAQEIAFELGFDDPSHFSRLFKKHTGQSPTGFKKTVESSSAHQG